MLFYLAIVLFLAVAMIGGAFVLRQYLGGAGPVQAVSALFGPKPLRRRLSVTEQFNLDNRRRLILVRRDNVEHLIMTGGPVDIVLETGIGVSEEAVPGAAAPQRVDPTLA
ncbi:flagellar biosynthetic protein FliO [Hyphomicrobium sp.]|uniref:flagellar biosynthetic protein FliO n=1 Tax=Hyphomicrobium sp. TaxID=82 RepID=UPI0025BB5966|nr:flagellar biosynthetic protein FliO [Hyphomicrobium sp.]MCC7252932.1 flagellar biosynthetic protein FliO [Hyphomicrobium sp.]